MIPANTNVPGRLLRRVRCHLWRMLPAIAEARHLTLRPWQMSAVVENALAHLDAKEISELAGLSTGGILAAACALNHSLEVITVAAALRRILAIEALGRHPRAELLRRAEAMVEDVMANDGGAEIG
jgi:hypothetical protein